MTKYPIVNALSALGYIILVASILNLVSRTLGDKPDTFLAPVAFLSLLTLSVTMMAFIFFYQPIRFFIDGRKKEALDLFVKTVSIFAVFTTIVWILIFLGLL